MQVKVLIQHSSGAPAVLLPLDNELPLSQIREQLQAAGIMTADDYFLFKGNTAQAALSAESIFKLQDVICADIDADAPADVFTLYIGQAHGEQISEDLTQYHKWENLSLAQQRQVLAVSYAARGFTLNLKQGLVRSFKDAYALKELPLSTDIGANTLTQSDYAFSKAARDLKLNFSAGASLDLKIPFFDAGAEYKYQQEHSVSSEQAEEYLLYKLLVIKAKLKLEQRHMQVNPQFVNDAFAAVKVQDPARSMGKLLSVLNEWGFYVPLCFTLGGMMYSSEQTKISDFKEAASESHAFSSTVQSKFVSGGFSFDSTGSESTEISSKYKNSMIIQIGGTEGSSISAEVFASSLENPLQWKIIDTAQVLPTVVLLNNHGMEGLPLDLGTLCIDLINEHYNLPIAVNMEPCLNLHAYATHAQRLL